MELKDIAIKLNKSKIKAGEGKDNGKYPLFTCSPILNKFLDEYQYDDEAIIVGTGGNVVINYYKGKFNYSTDCLTIKTNEDFYTKYIYYFLIANKEKISKMFRGAGLKHLNKNEFFTIDIKERNKKEQNEIIKTLDILNKIIENKNNELIKLDNIVKSQFVEMFGQCNKNIKLGECCEIHARIGWQALTKAEHMNNGEFMLVTGTDFKNNEINYSTCLFVSKERYDMDKKIILRNNDILITKDGTIGKVAIVHDLPKPATLNSGIFVIRPNEKFVKEYIAYVFKGPLFEDFINKSKTGATIKHLNQKTLVEFNIPLPPIELQNQFAEVVKQIDKQKFVIEQQIKII